MNRLRFAVCVVALCAIAPMAGSVAQVSADPFTMDQVLSFPFVAETASAKHADRIAWVRVVNGVRNIWVADGPTFAPRQITRYSADDGQEITQLTFSPDGKRLIYVRGGDHDSNWPAAGDLAPDPDSSSQQAMVTIWAASLSGAAPVKVADGDDPALSDDGRVAFVNNHKVWLAQLSGKTKPAFYFFDRGNAQNLNWSPDGKRLAFVSHRDGDHSFIGIYANAATPLLYLAPSTNRDDEPVWSQDGSQIAFTRQPGEGGAPEPILKQTPHPWSIWIADTTTGAGHAVWQSPETLPGSYPETDGGANLHWMAGNRLAFLAELDNWPHLYSVPANGGAATLLTPGNFMAEHIVESHDGRSMLYTANTGNDASDDDRRHIYRVVVDGSAPPLALTSGDGVAWYPAAASDSEVAFVSAGPRRPASVAMVGMDGKGEHDLNAAPLPKDFPLDALVVPKRVTFQSPDGLTIHGQLFQRDDGVTKPGIIFVHGGPPRQMLLGWHYMDYYANAYAVNQYLAAHGFTVLSVNYRLGIGYGRAFQHPDRAGPTGAAEYQDVLAGARVLQKTPGVDPNRIGIWGGSYGGYLTAMGLARNSDIFKAGVDYHGVHDWSGFIDEWFGKGSARYEKGDRDEAMKVAFDSSPVSSMDTWKSPVLLIHGDDDRNVHFQQTIDIARRLDAHHLYYEELVIPNDIHGFLRHASWDEADKANVAFFAKELAAPH